MINIGSSYQGHVVIRSRAVFPFRYQLGCQVPSCQFLDQTFHFVYISGLANRAYVLDWVEFCELTFTVDPA